MVYAKNKGVVITETKISVFQHRRNLIVFGKKIIVGKNLKIMDGIPGNMKCVIRMIIKKINA